MKSQETISAETSLVDVINSASECSITTKYEPVDSVEKSLKSHGSPQIFLTEKLLEVAADEGNLQKIAVVLDLALSLAESYTDLYYSLIETAFSTLSTDLGTKFWPYLEARASILATAQGPNSITFLRTCRSFLTRLDPQLNSETSGRVIQLLAVTKGFGHPSRLNKRGKIAAALELPADGNEATPYVLTQVFQDLSRLSEDELSTLFAQLLKQLPRRRAFKQLLSSAEFNFHGYTWRDGLPPDGLGLFTEELMIALSTITKTTSENENLQVLISKLSNYASDTLGNDCKRKLARIFTSEREWRQWKDKSCPFIDTNSSNEAISQLQQQQQQQQNQQNQHGVKGTLPLDLTKDKALPSLLANIGNPRLTRLLKAQPDAEQFSVVPSHANGSSLESPKTKEENNVAAEVAPHRDSLIFSARKNRTWKDLIEKQQQEPVDEHEECKKAEQDLRNLRDPAPRSSKRPSGETTEPQQKRLRISYEEDERYQDRLRGAQVTAKPLPY